MADYFSLLAFIIIMVGTPGPTNLVLMTAGSRYGFFASVPFIGGITMGKLLLNMLLIVGLYSWLEREPMLLTGLKFISASYMIWLSIRMLRDKPFSTTETKTPPGFLAGLIVHPLNPKAWAMTTIALADYGPMLTDPLMRFVVIAGSFVMVQLCFHSLWCYGGSWIMRMISSDRGRSFFQHGLALITVALVLWIVMT